MGTTSAAQSLIRKPTTPSDPAAWNTCGNSRSQLSYPITAHQAEIGFHELGTSAITAAPLPRCNSNVTPSFELPPNFIRFSPDLHPTFRVIPYQACAGESTQARARPEIPE